MEYDTILNIDIANNILKKYYLKLEYLISNQGNVRPFLLYLPGNAIKYDSMPYKISIDINSDYLEFYLNKIDIKSNTKESYKKGLNDLKNVLIDIDKLNKLTLPKEIDRVNTKNKKSF